VAGRLARKATRGRRDRARRRSRPRRPALRGTAVRTGAWGRAEGRRGALEPG